MNETEEALKAVGADPLSDSGYVLPSWAVPIVEQIARESAELSSFQKFVRYAKLFAILFAFLGVTFFLCLTLYWLGEPYGEPVVEFPDGIHVLNADGSGGNVIVEAGGEVILRGSYCKNRSTLTTVIHREFHDGLVYTLPEVVSNVSVGCGDNINTPLRIPQYLPPNTYTIVFRFDYQINPLRSDNYEFETNSFTVVAPAGAP